MSVVQLKEIHPVPISSTYYYNLLCIIIYNITIIRQAIFCMSVHS